MDYTSKLARLEHLQELVEAYSSKSSGGDGNESRRLHREICEAYGEVADVFSEIVGRREIQVPPPRPGSPSTRGAATFPNYFEAGFLSGRTFYTHEGRTELLKVLGAVRRLVQQHAATAAPEKSNRGQRVFIVHGRDESVLHSVARFIEKLSLPVTILREQPNKGRTLIEKFEDHADVGFAIVLLTGDDRGALADAPVEKQRRRPRQNVVFELGFFIGRLGRENVCALYEDGVEIPSDYSGIAFVPLDQRNAWHLELAREMKAAGLPVDMNKAL